MAVELYDFHSHILPGMDDGYPDAESAVQALKCSYAQGVRYMVATPHYYADEPVERFLQRREKAMEQLMEAMEKDGGRFPQICLGAEVAYYPNISYLEELDRLSIGKSEYLLLELPFRQWGMEVVRDVQNICNAGQVNLILAHIERYLPYLKSGNAAQMLRLELQMQMDTQFITDRKTRRLARKILKDNPPFLLGTDCHDLTDRKPDMGEAVEILHKRAMEKIILQAMELSEAVWKEAVSE